MQAARSYCFIDLETTGASSSFDRIIDIGIIKTDGKKILQKYETLVNPGISVNPFITDLTNITDDMLVNAPTFYEIMDEIQEILKDSIIVAHNVRFDYGFLKGEFRRYEKSFTSKHLCSVRLARRLFPGHNHYNLDSIIERFNLKCKRRHRAYDDAKAIFDFYKIASKMVDKTTFQDAIDFCLKRPTLPLGIKGDVIDSLPEDPGVYMFYSDSDQPLYIGKSVNIRDRVMSHFSNDLMSGKDREIAEQIKSIEYIRTAGELGALLLESTLIKKHQPLYNSQLRYARKMTVLVKEINENGFSTISIKEVDMLTAEDTRNLLGTFRSMKQLKNTVYELSKQHFLCPKILGIEKGKGKCFYYDLKICRGACLGKELNIAFNMRFEEAFYKYKVKKWIFGGPIIVKEKGDVEEGFIVDKWCLLGNIKNEDDLSNLNKEYRFDFDTYKILAKFLLLPPNNISINPISL